MNPTANAERGDVPSNLPNDVFPPQMFEATVQSNVIYGVVVALC